MSQTLRTLLFFLFFESLLFNFAAAQSRGKSHRLHRYRRGFTLPAVAREVLRAGPNVSDLRAAGERMLDAVAYLSVL